MENDIKEKIFNAVFQETGVPRKQVEAKNRQIEVVRARDIFIAIARNNLYSYSTIARTLNKDHTSIIHSSKKRLLPWMDIVVEKYKNLNIEIVKKEEEKPKKIVRIKLSGKYGYLHHIFSGKCVVCEFDEVVEVHHVIPRHLGGTDDQENLVLLCPNHHALADRGMLSVKERVIPINFSNPQS